MKKSLFALCTLALAFAACDKTEGPQIVPELKLTTEAAITVPQEGDIINVTFESNVNWTATLDVEKDVASLNVKNGTKEEGKVKITVMPLTEDNAVRTITLTLTPENGKPVNVILTQNGPFVPFFTVSEESLEFGVEGGTKNFTISTNVEYTVTETSIGKLTINGENAEYVMPATSLWSPRRESVIFTIESIQVPAIDDEGNEIPGKTVAMTVVVGFSQDGHIEYSYKTKMTDEMMAALPEGSSRLVNTALTADLFLVSQGQDVIYAFDRKTGAFVSSKKFAFPISSIANDSEGNIVVLTGGQAENAPMTFYFVPAATPLDESTYVKGFDATCQHYGYGYNNISANGNIFKGDALITAFCGAAGGASQTVCWALKDGKRADDGNITDYIGLPTMINDPNIWSSKWGVTRHLTTNPEGGIYYGAYDGVYNLHYNASMSKANWTAGVSSGGSWVDGICAIEFADWNSHKYLLAYSYSFFVGYNSYVDVFTIDNPAEPVLVDRIPVLTDFGGEGSTSADICVAVEDGKLVFYAADYTHYGVIKGVMKAI